MTDTIICIRQMLLTEMHTVETDIFHARRSKDLVNWEYLGATMTETPPTWIKEKLNAYRAEMGLEPTR